MKPKVLGKGAERRRKGGKKARMIFVTGTDTGVGKTVLTCLLLAHLRGEGVEALAVKPFCSGGRGDAEALRRVMLDFPVKGRQELEAAAVGRPTRVEGYEGVLTIEEINPYYFDKPVAPRAALIGTPGGTPRTAGETPELLKASQMKGGAVLRLPQRAAVVKHIEGLACRCEIMLIEGAGGLLVPLGADFTVADLILALGAEVVVVSRNALGTINHTLLTVEHLQGLGMENITVVLMGQVTADASVETNLEVLGEMAPEIRFVSVPFLGWKPLMGSDLKKSVNFLKKTLAGIMDQSIVSLPARKGG